MEILNHSNLPDETQTIQKRMSQADVKLKEIEHELQHAQEKICYIKQRLVHMKDVCEKRKLINSQEFVNSSCKSSICVVSSVQESNYSSINDYETSYDALSNDESFHEDIRSFYSYMSKTSSTKSIVVNNASFAFFENTFDTEKHIIEDKKPSVTKIITNVISDKSLNHENNSEEKMSTATDELSSSSHNFDNCNNVELQEIFKPFPPTPKSDKKSQLILKINAAHKKTPKQHITTKSDKMKKNLSHANVMANKKSQLNKVHKNNCPLKTRKQKKLKLKKSSLNYFESKNSVFIRLAQKNRKKFKRRALMNRKPKNSLLKSNTKGSENIKKIEKHDPTSNVVELYHNTATKNTSSVESSKHQIKPQNEADNEGLGQNQNLMEFIHNDVVNANSMNINCVNSPKDNPKKPDQLEITGHFYEAGTQDSISRQKKKPDKPQAEDHHGHENCRSRSFRSECEWMPPTKNYQQPTISSKLKEVEKCYLGTKSNVENIPFVVGTSVNRSYNLGLNIQQTLNLLKTKQHQITPDLQDEPINKTGKTLNSVIQSLLEPLDINSDNFNINSIIQSKSSIYPNVVKEADNATIKVEQSNESTEIRQKKSIIPNIKNLSADINLTESKNSLSNYRNFSSSETMENTMRKIQNRFNVLNKKYDYLQNQLFKTNDKKIKKELTQVENELNEKEEEIRAIVGLYLEIISLKQQIKVQHNSSLLYITTKCSTHNSTKIKSSTTTRPQNSHSLHITEYRQRKTSINKKIPTAKTFAGLLRNIQTIQHQLTTI